MDLLSLLILIIVISWILGSPAPGPSANIVWVIVVIAVILMLGGGYSGYHSGYWWPHR